ncbi:MAG: putative quinol monooxygenase [Brevinema sp.]
MAKVIVVAQVEAKQDKIDFVKSEVLKLVAPTRVEAGCIKYDLHQDNANPALFLFYEIWEDEATLKVHSEGAHLKAFAQATKGAIHHSSINKMTLIES